ncbi:Lipoprotein-releasing system ATP-binding protein LolD [Phycisphaerae bacterium RAS1]|nr:Lipoprotein-releasing system ATP-binding protein LolD [Phycisphaerae bacterium RAS1]
MVDILGVEHSYTHAGVIEPVLHGVNLTLRRGEFVVLMGPSGCGKSTLLNVLGLMMSPTRAQRFALAGNDALHMSDARRTLFRRRHIGFVFQRFNLLPTISARANVALPLRIAGAGVDGQVDELLRAVDILPHARKKPRQLSVGQQQRVAIARAMVTRPALLLADEPTGNLDSANADAVLRLLSRFHREFGQTILMITHNEQLAVEADRVLHMRDGRIVGS